MKRAMVLLAAALSAEPAAVYAGSSCGGGGGGGGGSSSGGGGGSSSGGGGGGSSSSGGGSYSGGDYSGSSGGSSGGCIDDTDVHGFRHCTTFGAWGANMRMPRLFVELGTGVRQFSTGLGAQTGGVAHGAEQFSYRVVMPTSEPADDVAMVTQMRIGFGMAHGLYSGLELELGGLVGPASATTEMASTGGAMTDGMFGSPDVRQAGGLVVGFSGIGGFRATGRRGSLAVEAAGGLRNVRYQFASSYHYCETTSVISQTRGIVEARARGELWLNPWITAGAIMGASVVDQGDWMAGLYVGFHSRAFAGGR